MRQKLFTYFTAPPCTIGRPDHCYRYPSACDLSDASSRQLWMVFEMDSHLTAPSRWDLKFPFRYCKRQASGSCRYSASVLPSVSRKPLKEIALCSMHRKNAIIIHSRLPTWTPRLRWSQMMVLMRLCCFSRKSPPVLLCHDWLIDWTCPSPHPNIVRTTWSGDGCAVARKYLLRCTDKYLPASPSVRYFGTA